MLTLNFALLSLCLINEKYPSYSVNPITKIVFSFQIYSSWWLSKS
jgi:hypothetical protein